MPKRIILLIFCLLFIYTLLSKAYAQSFADSLNTAQNAYDNTVNKFYNSIGAKARLYNGEGYDGYYPGATGNPYFSDAADWAEGSIMYDGYIYKDVKIRYNLYIDRVVIPLYNSALAITLLNDKLTSFDVLGHHFICVKNNESAINPLQTGIYDELYGGKTQVLCKRDKTLQQDHSGTTITSYFAYTADYYVFKNNQYFPANSRGDFLAVFKDKKKELQQFIRDNKLKFNKSGKEQAMAKVAEYYDHISG